MAVRVSAEQSSGKGNQELSTEETDAQIPPPPPPRRVSHHPLLRRLRRLCRLQPNDDRDYKRVGKMSYTWMIAVLTASVTLLLTTPDSVDNCGRAFVRAAATALSCLSLFTAVGLIYYSVLNDSGAQLAKVQETVMGFSAVTIVLAVLLRVALLFPFLHFLAMIMASVVLFALLLIYLAHKIES